MQVTTFLQCYLFLPLGGLLLLSCLAGYRYLSFLTNRVCQQRLHVGYVNMRLVSLMLLLTLGFFAREHVVLMRIYTSPGYAQYCGNSNRSALGRNWGLDEKAAQRDPIAAAASAAASQAAAAALTSGEPGLHCMAYKLRHERNWWLSLLSFTMWMLVWRVTALLCRYDTQLGQLERQKQLVLAEIGETRRIWEEEEMPEITGIRRNKTARVAAPYTKSPTPEKTARRQL